MDDQNDSPSPTLHYNPLFQPHHIGIPSYQYIVDSLFYLIPRFQRFASNPENIKPNEPWIFISLSFSLHLSKKWKQDFKIQEICFARFYADITSNFSLLIRNLQYPIIQHKYFSLVYQLWIVKYHIQSWSYFISYHMLLTLFAKPCQFQQMFLMSLSVHAK